MRPEKPESGYAVAAAPDPTRDRGSHRGRGQKEPPMNKIGQVRKFLQKQFPLERWKDGMTDERKRPQIPVGTIAQAIIEMVPRGQTSLLEVDQDVREPEFRAWHGSDREMVVSDSTLERSLSGFGLPPIRDALWEMAQIVSKRPGMRMALPSGRKVRLGILDGSVWGRFHGSVLALTGKRTTIVAGYEMSAGRGHELAASRKVLTEARKELGRGFVDLVVEDGLYLTAADFRWSVETGGFHMVVKTSEESLTVIQDARELFFGNPGEMNASLERAQGIDVVRGIEYEIISAAGFRWGNLPYPLKVAWVRERLLKPKSGHPTETTFWVLTTDETLKAEDMREVAHQRWQIENNVFRRLSALVDSKRRLTADAHVREALLGLWFLGFNLFGVFMAWTRIEFRHPLYRTAKVTWKWLTRSLARDTWRAVDVRT